MIADSREPPDSNPPGNGGLYGGALVPTLNDRRVRANANRLTKLVEAGEIAAERLGGLLDKIETMMQGKLKPREVAALGKLQFAIAMVPVNRGDTHNHLHLHETEASAPSAEIEDAEYIDFIAGREAPDNVQSGGASQVVNGWKMGSLSSPSITEPPANGHGGGKAANGGS